MTKHLVLQSGHWEWEDFASAEQLPVYAAPADTNVSIEAGSSATTPGVLQLLAGANTAGGVAGTTSIAGGGSSDGGAASLMLPGAGAGGAALYSTTGGSGLAGGGLTLNGGDGDTGNVAGAQLTLQPGDGSSTPGGAALRINGVVGPGALVSDGSALTYVQAADPGDIPDPSTATTEEVATAYNTLLANLRSAALIA